MTPASVFDRMAASYDERWTNTPIGSAQRRLVWSHVDGLFQPGQFLLDVGCGTGEDAAHFAARGMRVYATDASPAMVQACGARKCPEGAQCATTVRCAEELAGLDGTFDAVLSNFGVLNCVRDLPAVATSLASLTKPGSVVAICLLGRICAWEVLYYSARLQFRKGFRRWRGGGVPYHELTIHYPSLSEVRAAFAAGFELPNWTGIGLFVPPSYVPLPAALVRACEALDRVLAQLPLLRALADHRLFLLVRK
jgi:ubiquinone/menaquinone biosynthesis C-methylase UbiE